MYHLTDAPTDTLLREIQFRIDAMEGCVMRGFREEDLLGELDRRACALSPGEQRERQREKVASLYGRVLGARRRLVGQGVPNDPFSSYQPDTPEAAAEREEPEDQQAERHAQEQLRATMSAVQERFGVLGARSFMDWFAWASPGGAPVKVTEDGADLLEIKDTHRPPEKATLVYRGADEIERQVRLGTARKWLREAKARASDDPRN